MFLEILPNSQKNIFVGISFLIKLQAAEGATVGSLQEKVLLEILQNSQENAWARVSILIKLQTWPGVFLAQVFSCKFCETSKNTFFTEYVWATAFKAGNLKLSEAATGNFQ